MKLSIVGAILVGLAVLLVAVTPARRESLLGYFDGVDASDVTPALLRYKFQPGQQLVFESTTENITTSYGYHGRSGGIRRMEARHVFDVLPMDEQGNTGMNVVMKRLVLETAAGYSQRRVEITPGGIRVFSEEGEEEPAQEDLEMLKAVTGQLSITVSPRGGVLSADIPGDELYGTWQMNQFLSSIFLELPEKEVVPGEQYVSEPVSRDTPLVKCLEDERQFLGYKEYEGQRCAVLKFSFLLQTEPSEEMKAMDVRDETKAKSVMGVLFSLERGLPLVTFMRLESNWERGPQGSTMRGRTEGTFVMKLVSASARGK